MAQLTWRNVDAPDFSQAMRGIRDFGSMFGDAFAGLKGGLKEYDNTLIENADRSLITDMAAAQDADAAKNVLAQLANRSGRAPSIAAINAATARPGQLLVEDNNRLTLDQGKYSFDRLKTENAGLDAARPDALTFVGLASKGDKAGADAFLANSKSLSGLSIDNIMKLAKGGMDLTTGNEGILTSQQNREVQLHEDARAQTRLGMDVESHSWERVDRNDRKSGEALAIEVLNQAGGSAEGARLVLNQLGGRLSPGARYAAMGLINQGLGGGIFGADEMTAAGGAAGVGGGTGGSMSPFQAILSNEGGITADGRFKTSPAGAIGPAQVMPATAPEAARLAGLKWDPVKYRTDANYNKAIGEAYYNQMYRQFGDHSKAAAAYNAGPGGLQAAMSKAKAAGRPDNWWSYLPSETKKYVTNFQKKTGIGAGRGSGLGNVATNNAAQVSLAFSRMQGDPDGLTNAVLQAANKDMSDGEVIAALKKEMPGTNEAFLREQVKRVMRDSQVDGKGGLNRAAAYEVIRRNVTDPRNNWEKAWAGITNPIDWASGRVTANLPGGKRLNDEGIDNFLTQFRKGDVFKGAITQANNQSQSARLPALAEAARAAASQYSSMVNRSSSQPTNPSVLALAEQRALAAQQAFEEAAGQSNNPLNGGAPIMERDEPVDTGYTPSVARQLRTEKPVPLALNAGGSSRFNQAKTALNAKGSKAVALRDQFERIHGMSPEQAIQGPGSSLIKSARAAASIGGVTGKKVREQFMAQNGMTPEEAIKRYSGG